MALSEAVSRSAPWPSAPGSPQSHQLLLSSSGPALFVTSNVTESCTTLVLKHLCPCSISGKTLHLRLKKYVGTANSCFIFLASASVKPRRMLLHACLTYPLRGHTYHFFITIKGTITHLAGVIPDGFPSHLASFRFFFRIYTDTNHLSPFIAIILDFEHP